jgi:hypothetical protein
MTDPVSTWPDERLREIAERRRGLDVSEAAALATEVLRLRGEAKPEIHGDGAGTAFPHNHLAVLGFDKLKSLVPCRWCGQTPCDGGLPGDPCPPPEHTEVPFAVRHVCRYVRHYIKKNGYAPTRAMVGVPEDVEAAVALGYLARASFNENGPPLLVILTETGRKMLDDG